MKLSTLIEYCILIFAILSFVTALISVILLVDNGDYVGAIGAFSTILSICLSIISIVYAFVSGKNTSKLLDDISIQNKSFIDDIEVFASKIHFEMSKDNYDDNNIKSVREAIRRKNESK